jgi:hypothetical protein
MSKTYRTIELKVTVDVVDRGGVGQRLTMAVPCDIPVHEHLPVIGEFELPNGAVSIWRGMGGLPMRPCGELLAALDPAGLNPGAAGGSAAEQAAHLNQLHYTRVVRDHHALTGRMAYGPANSEALPWDPAAYDGYDLSHAYARVEELRRNALRSLAVCGDELHVVHPLPVWSASAYEDRIQLQVWEGIPRYADNMIHAGFFVVGTFPVDRLEDARAFQRLRRGEREQEVVGRIRHLDPAYAPGTNLPDVAAVICNWLLESLRVEPADLEADLVGRWHDLHQGLAAARSQDRRRAAELLESALAFVEAVEGCPQAWRGGRSTLRRHPFWKTCLRRMEIEGIGTARPIETSTSKP